MKSLSENPKVRDRKLLAVDGRLIYYLPHLLLWIMLPLNCFHVYCSLYGLAAANLECPKSSILSLKAPWFSLANVLILLLIQTESRKVKLQQRKQISVQTSYTPKPDMNEFIWFPLLEFLWLSSNTRKNQGLFAMQDGPIQVKKKALYCKSLRLWLMWCFLMQTRYALRLASEEHWRVPNYYSCTLGGSLFFLLDTQQNKTSSVSLGEKKVVLTLWFCERPEKHVWGSTVLCYIQGMKVIVQQWASGCHLVEAKCGIWSEFCFFQWKQGGDLQHFFLCSISEGCYYQ